MKMMESRPLPLKRLETQPEYIHNLNLKLHVRSRQNVGDLNHFECKSASAEGCPMLMLHDAVVFCLSDACRTFSCQEVFKKYTSTCRKHINTAAVWQVDQLSHRVADCRYLRWVRDY